MVSLFLAFANRSPRRLKLATLTLAIMALGFGMQISSRPPVAAAQTGATYEISWQTVASGGGAASGGAYALDLTVGEPDTGAAAGGRYALGGGFWGAAVRALNNLFLPLIRR